MKKNLPVTQNEKDFPADWVIVTRTDSRGVITYANDEFVELSGFSREELVGKSHNVVRHPDMPPAVFKEMWDTLKAGFPWRGVVKNRCKNGDHYWVKATVVPVREDGKEAGFMSVRKKTSRKEIEKVETLYRELNGGKSLPKPGLARKFANLSLRNQLQFIIQPTLLVLLTVAQLLLYQAMKQNTLKNARLHVEASANEVIDGANLLMQTGAISDIENRKLLIRKFSSSGNVREVKLLRGKAVIAQYGPGLPGEQVKDEVERRVLESGKPYYKLEEDANGDPIYRAVTPYLASRDFHGGTDCMQCHDVKEGEVVGASSISIGLKEDFARLYMIQVYFTIGQVFLQVILFFFIGWCIQKFVRRPLDTAMRDLDRIVGGDLCGEIDISGRNEVGSLLCSMQSMQTQIGVMINRISSSANEIDEKTGKVTREVGLVAKQSENQSQSAMNAASAMEEISTSVSEVAANAGDAAQSVSVSNAKAENGNAAMANSVETSKQVVAAVTTSAETIAKLEAAVNSIGNIAVTIKDIADQTNLLALNAAIEAARAGEQGRGFAVVADEVRKLAEKTSASTADIGRTVSEVTGITRTAAEEMHAASVEVEKGMSSVLESAESLKEIAQQSAHAMSMTTHIADAVKQQALASEEIARNLAQISELSGANTEAAWRAEKETQELGAVAQGLQSMVRFFKL